MATRLRLDDALVNEAARLGKHKTKTAAVVEALKGYIQMKRRLGLIELIGQVEYDPSYDYKAARKPRSRRTPRRRG